MNPKRWAGITEEFDRLKDLPLVERERALALACDEEIKAAVRDYCPRMTTARARILNF